MASVSLDRDEAQDGDLPCLCICCGDADAEFEERRFCWHPWWVNHPLWVGFFRRHAVANLPFCDRHARGIGSPSSWFQKGPSLWGLRPTYISEEVLNLAGVSDEFLDALERYRDGERFKPPPRRRRETEEEEDDRSRPVAHRPRERRRSPSASSGSGALTVVLILLGVLVGVPVLGCAGLIVMAKLLPRQAPPPFPAPPPVVWPNPQPAALPVGKLRPEDAVGVLVVAPEGFPANLPWGALAVLGKPDLPRPPSDAEVARHLTALASGQHFTVRDAADALAKLPAVEKHRPAVADALMKLVTDRSVFLRESAYHGLAVWGRAEDVPGLQAALPKEPFPHARTALQEAITAIQARQ